MPTAPPISRRLTSAAFARTGQGDNWKTINGSHVLIEGGKIVGGASHLIGKSLGHLEEGSLKKAAGGDGGKAKIGHVTDSGEKYDVLAKHEGGQMHVGYKLKSGAESYPIPLPEDASLADAHRKLIDATPGGKVVVHDKGRAPAAKAAKEVATAEPAPAPAKEPPATAAPAATPRQALESAVAELEASAAGPGRRMWLSDVREKMAAHGVTDKAEQDKAILDRAKDGDAVLVHADNPAEKTPDRKAAVFHTPGGEDRHLMYWTGQPPRRAAMSRTDAEPLDVLTFDRSGPSAAVFNAELGPGYELPALGDDRPKEILGEPVTYLMKPMLQVGQVADTDEGRIVITADALEVADKYTRKWIKDGGKPFVPDRHRDFDAKSNLGWIRSTKFDGKTLWGEHALIGKDAKLLAARNDTSVLLRWGFSHGGNTYPLLVEHNAFVPDPKMGGLGDFVALSRAGAEPEQVPVYELAFDRAPLTGGRWVTIEGHAVYIRDTAGVVPARVKAEPGAVKRFTRANLEKAITDHHRDKSGESGEYTAGMERELTEAAGDANDAFRFHKKLPTEIKDAIGENPALRRVFTVTGDAKKAHGSDAYSALGDRYIDIAEARAGSPLRQAKAFAHQSGDPEAAFLAHVHDNLPAGGTKALEPVKAGGLRVGDEFTIGGKAHRVAEDEHGFRVLRSHEYGKGDVPLDAVQTVPVDRGSFRRSEVSRRLVAAASDGIPFSRRLMAFARSGGAPTTGSRGDFGIFREVDGVTLFFKSTGDGGYSLTPEEKAHLKAHESATGQKAKASENHDALAEHHAAKASEAQDRGDSAGYQHHKAEMERHEAASAGAGDAEAAGKAAEPKAPAVKGGTPEDTALKVIEDMHAKGQTHVVPAGVAGAAKARDTGYVPVYAVKKAIAAAHPGLSEVEQNNAILRLRKDGKIRILTVSQRGEFTAGQHAGSIQMENATGQGSKTLGYIELQNKAGSGAGDAERDARVQWTHNRARELTAKGASSQKAMEQAYAEYKARKPGKAVALSRRLAFGRGTFDDEGYFRTIDGQVVFFHGTPGYGYTDSQAFRGHAKVLTASGTKTVTVAPNAAGHRVTESGPGAGQHAHADHPTAAAAVADARSRVAHAETAAKANGSHVATMEHVPGERPGGRYSVRQAAGEDGKPAAYLIDHKSGDVMRPAGAIVRHYDDPAEAHAVAARMNAREAGSAAPGVSKRLTEAAGNPTVDTSRQLGMFAKDAAGNHTEIGDKPGQANLFNPSRYDKGPPPKAALAPKDEPGQMVMAPVSKRLEAAAAPGEPAKSAGHVGFYRDPIGRTRELYKGGPDNHLRSADPSTPIDPATGQRSGRWEASASQADATAANWMAGGKELRRQGGPSVFSPRARADVRENARAVLAGSAAPAAPAVSKRLEAAAGKGENGGMEARPAAHELPALQGTTAQVNYANAKRAQFLDAMDALEKGGPAAGTAGQSGAWSGPQTAAAMGVKPEHVAAGRKLAKSLTSAGDLLHLTTNYKPHEIAAAAAGDVPEDLALDYASGSTMLKGQARKAARILGREKDFEEAAKRVR